MGLFVTAILTILRILDLTKVCKLSTTNFPNSILTRYWGGGGMGRGGIGGGGDDCSCSV